MLSTVVIALYNGEKYILEQLESIRSQTLTPDEVIIADDGSTDKGPELVQNFISKYELTNWKLLINEKNQGWANNFVYNTKNAKGDLIFFCDQDDIWFKNKIEVMLKIMKNREICLLSCENDFIFTDTSIRYEDVGNRANNNEIEKILFSSDSFPVLRPGCSMCIKREYFETIYPFWKENWPHDDFCWKFALLDGKSYYIHTFLMSRRIHGTNTSIKESKKKHRNKKGRIKQLYNMKIQYESLLNYVEGHSVDKKVIQFLEKSIRALKLRLKFMQTKNIFIWMRLFLCYRDTYPRAKGIYLDFCIVYLGEKFSERF